MTQAKSAYEVSASARLGGRAWEDWPGGLTVAPA